MGSKTEVNQKKWNAPREGRRIYGEGFEGAREGQEDTQGGTGMRREALRERAEHTRMHWGERQEILRPNRASIRFLPP